VKKIKIIAEIGINHNGDIDLAKELIRRSADAQAHAVKFQKRTVEKVYTKEELDNYRESPWGKTNRDQKLGLEFSVAQYEELKAYTTDLGLDFIVSCWDIDSIEDVEKLDVSYHKVASALATDRKFLQRINATGKPVILSTGMCTSEQIGAAVSLLDNIQYILACTSTYPTAIEELNLKHIATLKEEYPHLKIGFSNHYGGHVACVGAVALGAECVEFHITHNRNAYGSDQAASIEEPKRLVEAINNMQLMLGDGIKKIYESEIPIAQKLRKVINT
tara:strand:+ start:525 stop:1352 length:828 start_codon:yes stop_codon:yes gene_type:complete